MNSATPSLAHSLTLAESAAAAHVFIRRFPTAASGQRVGRLPGVPITIKDNIDVAGFVTTAGSRLLANSAPARVDAPVVARLRAAGAVLLGHTNMTEFAFSGLGINPHFGTPANPAFSTAVHIPGGSSSGAAVSVALGIAPVALGTDTGGSVRIPAAFCGLVGFKPTAATISLQGVLPLSTSLDSVGVIGTSVADCRMTFDTIRDPVGNATDSRSQLAMAGLRLGVVRGYVDEDLDPDVAHATQEFLQRLRAAGASLVELTVPELTQIPAMNARGTLPAAEAWAWHRKYLPQDRAAYDPRVLARIERGAAITPALYQELKEARAVFAGAFSARIAPFAAVLWPTTPITAPVLDGLSDAQAYDRCNMRVLRNSTIVNLADGCAISLPCPDSTAPVGITLAASRGQDSQLLEVAAAVEAVVGGHSARARIGDYLGSLRT